LKAAQIVLSDKAPKLECSFRNLTQAGRGFNVDHVQLAGELRADYRRGSSPLPVDLANGQKIGITFA
jgi:hypothetical protein